jgi:hypothetical protein
MLRRFRSADVCRDGSWGYVHKQFSDWSISLFCFDAGVSFVLTYPLGCFLQMPWPKQLVLFGASLFTITAAIFVYINASQKRVRRAQQTLRSLAASIEIPGALMVKPMRIAGPKRDPVVEASPHLLAMFKPEIVNSYHASQNIGNPDIAAKLFLQQLAESVSNADFRD